MMMVKLSVMMSEAGPGEGKLAQLRLDFETPVDGVLQAEFERVDRELVGKLGMEDQDRAAGLIDLRTGRVALIHPDRMEYAASVPKIGILLAYFHLQGEAALEMDDATRHELGRMVKASDNGMAAKYSRELGLKAIQEVLNEQGFYDRERGGGIWVGKHYGRSEERIGDPLADHSHAATVRQVLRFFLLLEQGELESPGASRAMKEIFAAPGIPHDEIHFVAGLKGRELEVIRKWGAWEDWKHDAAVIRGPGRQYILVGLTHHERGGEYLEGLARSVDDLLKGA